jgi:uncharacterized glyoxalase superfamily protein PhnB
VHVFAQYDMGLVVYHSSNPGPPKMLIRQAVIVVVWSSQVLELALNRAEILRELGDTDYGSRDFICRDPEGRVWCFGTYWPKVGEPPLPASES